MLSTENQPLEGRKRRAHAVPIILAIVLSMCVGCATGGNMATPGPGESFKGKKPSVERFKDGRGGFIITEFPDMDERSRTDFDRAVSLLKEQDYEQAIVLLQQVIGQSPGVTAPYIDIAMAYRGVGDLEQAEAHLKTALTLFPDHPVACNEYGLLYRKTGRFAEAREIYEKAIVRFPDYYPVYRNLGILCDLYLNDLECALEQYEIYSEARPEEKRVKLWIADLRARLGRN